MIMIIQGYVILMKNSFVVSLFYVEQQQLCHIKWCICVSDTQN